MTAVIVECGLHTVGKARNCEVCLESFPTFDLVSHLGGSRFGGIRLFACLARLNIFCGCFLVVPLAFVIGGS